MGNNNVAGNSIAKTEKYRRLLVGSIVPTKVPLPRATAFYADMSHDDESPGKGHTLKFDVIKTNINGCYNPFSGIFTVPDDGVYVFTFSLRLYLGVFGAYEIMKNADVEGTAIGIIEGSNTQLQVTETIVFSVNKGDIVYVRTHPRLTHTGGVWTNENGRSMFAGWQISHSLNTHFSISCGVIVSTFGFNAFQFVRNVSFLTFFSSSVTAESILYEMRA